MTILISFFFSISGKKKFGFYKHFFVFFYFYSIPFPHSHPYSPHSHPDSPHSHPYSPHSHPGSPHSHPDYPHSHPYSPHPHPDSPHSHPHSPHLLEAGVISCSSNSFYETFCKVLGECVRENLNNLNSYWGWAWSRV